MPMPLGMLRLSILFCIASSSVTGEAVTVTNPVAAGWAAGRRTEAEAGAGDGSEGCGAAAVRALPQELIQTATAETTIN